MQKNELQRMFHFEKSLHLPDQGFLFDLHARIHELATHVNEKMQDSAEKLLALQHLQGFLGMMNLAVHNKEAYHRK